jgi:hypothetical protein
MALKGYTAISLMSILLFGGGLLGVLLGSVARVGYLKTRLPIAVAAVAGSIGLLPIAWHRSSWLPLSLYGLSLLTGYVVTALLEGSSGDGEHRKPARQRWAVSFRLPTPRWRPPAGATIKEGMNQ